jgi:Holliday junction DNA helicase RuvA
VIALLRGRVARQGEDHVVLDVQGVGYLVQASGRSLRHLPAEGEAVEMLIDLHLSDETIRLYGFIDDAERDCFRLLQTVQGVGARVALSVLGAVGPDGLAAAVAAGDRAALTRAPGVGARLAARILAELKERLGEIRATPAGAIPMAAAAPGTPEGDAAAALARLGFGRSEIAIALSRVRGRLGDGIGLDALVREGLKELSRTERAG